MIEPWFSEQYAWVPGTVLGCTAGLWGGLTGILAPRGKAKGLVIGAFWVLFGSSLILLVGGVAAYFGGQPYGIWYGLGLAGIVGAAVLGGNAPQLFHLYRKAEERRMNAQDMA